MPRTESRTGSGELSRILDESDQVIRDDISSLRGVIDMFGGTSVMLVLDRDAISATGIRDELEDQVAGLSVSVFDRFSPNPSSEHAAEAARKAVSHDARLIIGVGGGSCLDVAKVSSMAASRPDLIDALARGEGTHRAEPLPIVAVPTTSGTGSETTHFSAIYVEGKKVSVTHPGIRPRAVILDPMLHRAMPRAIAAITGLDALGQSMESIWSVGSDHASYDFALRAGTLIGRSIVDSVNEVERDARICMMCGAHLAGRAINISKTTASHAMSYRLTTRFGIPHGHGVALTLGHVGAFNFQTDDSDCLDPRGPDSVRGRVEVAASVLGATPDTLPGVVRSLLVDLGLAPTLKAAGVDRGSIPELAETVDPVRLGNNPRTMTRQDVESLLERAWDA